MLPTYAALLRESNEKNICVRGLHAERRHGALAILPHPGGRHVLQLHASFSINTVQNGNDLVMSPWQLFTPQRGGIGEPLWSLH